MSAIVVRGLRKAYGGLEAVRGIDFEIEEGEVFGLLGPNGAGKTTTVEILEGYRTRDAGEVEVLGEDPQRAGQAWRERVGVVLQSSSLYPHLTARESLALFAGYYSRPRDVDEVVELVGLGEKAGARVRTLSGGQKRRLDLGLALVGNPELLFLDEPTTGLDPQSRRQLWEIIRRFKHAGGTVLLTTHYMEEAERLCDRVAIMDHGKVIALGSPDELIASLGADQIVEFALSDGTTPAGLDVLPGVKGVRPGPDRIALTVAHVHRTVPALLGLIERQGAELSLLATHQATLDDVFVALTGRQLRDE